MAANKDAHKYADNLEPERLRTKSGNAPAVQMHSSEWRKVMNGDPVEINPSTGGGFRVMTVDEWASRWKRNEDFPECLSCGGSNTKEHYFSCTWCRGHRHWASETLCLDCHTFSHREYQDSAFKTPDQWEKEYWTQITRKHQQQHQQADRAAVATGAA